MQIWSTESDEPFRNWNREDVITGQSQCIAWVPGTESTVAWYSSGMAPSAIPL